MNTKKVLVVGGDLRQVYLAQKLADKIYGNTKFLCYVYALEKNNNKMRNIIVLNSLDEIKNVDILILPMPVLNINDFINTPLSDKKIKLDDLLSVIDENTKVFGGKFSNEMIMKFSLKNIKYYDYLKREELAIHNAIPTAEGTIEILMQEMPKTIFGSKILIIGAGRISRILRKNLFSLGANVTVSARKKEDFAWIECDKCKYVHNKNIDTELYDKDAVINTVPDVILNADKLKKIDDDTLIIDLASKPGGVDFITANKLGKKTIWALSLPGKVAPITAGHIILQTILNILDETEDIYE